MYNFFFEPYLMMFLFDPLIFTTSLPIRRAFKLRARLIEPETNFPSPTFQTDSLLFPLLPNKELAEVKTAVERLQSEKLLPSF